jgi:molecular chaperone HtpG
MTVKPQQQTLNFETETKQLLNLVAHSLYSNKEVFLRELISNASDAAEKLRFEALSDESLYENDPELKIWVSFDSEKRTITVSDNGIGMTRDQVTENLGTIASSGTKKFLSHMTGDKEKDSQLIGQFGVGFYSAFVIADKVSVTTRYAGMTAEHGVYWESEGEGSYTVQNINKDQRGTTVVLHLKESEDEFLDQWRLRQIITKYSDHILLPIMMPKQQSQQEDEAEQQQPQEQQPEWEVVNQATALWARPKSEITDEQYQELYKHIAHDFENPLTWVHNKVEGKLEYISLLYIPSRAPFDLWTREQQNGLKLYVQRVFVTEDTEKLLPFYLRFVRGIIDSSDLPLNVSREMLQSNKVIDNIRNATVKRVLDLLERTAEHQPDHYQQFWNEFGKVLKEGPAEDYTNRDRIAKLLRFASTHNDSDEQSVSLDDYIGRMKEGQDKIYYVTAESYNMAKNSPHLEFFRKKGIEVLLLSDRVDEWLVAHLGEYEGKQLQSIAHDSVDLSSVEGEQDKEAQQKAQDEYKDLVEKMQHCLGDTVKEVRVSERLTDSPSCLVSDKNDLSLHMKQLLQSMGQNLPSSQLILEINPDHPLIKRLNHYDNETQLQQWAQLLFDQAYIAEGGQLDDPASFVKRMNQLLVHSALQ